MMMRMVAANFWKFLHQTRGATAVEYGLLAALIVLAIVTAVGAVGGPSQGHFEAAANAWPS